MPKKSTVSSEEILLAAIDEELILNDDGNIPGPSHEIWRRLSIKVECRTSPKNIYTRVKGNRENLLTSIMNKKGVACDKRSDREADSLRGSETSHNEETKDQEEESIEYPTKTFKVVLSADDFKKMKPVYTKLKMKKLGKLRARYTLPPYIWAEQIGKLLWEQQRIPCPFAEHLAKHLTVADIKALESSITTSFGVGAPFLCHSLSQYSIEFASCFSESIWTTGIWLIAVRTTPSYKKMWWDGPWSLRILFTSDPVASIVNKTYCDRHRILYTCC